MVMSQASVSFHLPAPALRHAISTYYVLRIAGSEEVEDIIHPEWANVRLILSGSWRTRFAEQPLQSVPDAAMSGTLERGAPVWGTPGILIGLGILPEGWVLLTNQQADAFANRLRPLSEAFGPGADDLLPALRAAPSDGDALEVLDRYFTGQVLQRPPVAPIVRDAHAALISVANRSVKDWADRLSLSTRQLERLCLRYFGLRPKRLLRRQRFLRTLAAIREVEPGSWSGLIDAHYVDQSHFIREFHYFLGMSPSAYFARPQPFMRQAGDRRKALLGSPVQGLHAPAAAERGQGEGRDQGRS
jgi:AraC-like DNA-binding protein